MTATNKRKTSCMWLERACGQREDPGTVPLFFSLYQDTSLDTVIFAGPVWSAVTGFQIHATFNQNTHTHTVQSEHTHKPFCVEVNSLP